MAIVALPGGRVPVATVVVALAAARGAPGALVLHAVRLDARHGVEAVDTCNKASSKQSIDIATPKCYGSSDQRLPITAASPRLKLCEV
jgi:hypothetical protein